MPFRYDKSNGFMEKTILFIVAVVSLAFAEFHPSHLLTLWYAILGGVTLYLVAHFDIFSFSSADWRQVEATDWSAHTLGQVPSEYLDTTTGIYERIAPGHGFFWWVFRILYLLLGIALWALVCERLVMGTSTIAMKLVYVLIALEKMS